MSAPTITLDSERPGLMGLTVHGTRSGDPPTTVWLTLREAEQFALDIASTTRTGFMRAQPEPWERDPEKVREQYGLPPTCEGMVPTWHEDDPTIRPSEWYGRGSDADGELSEDDPTVQHEHPYADELHLGGG